MENPYIPSKVASKTYILAENLDKRKRSVSILNLSIPKTPLQINQNNQFNMKYWFDEDKLYENQDRNHQILSFSCLHGEKIYKVDVLSAFRAVVKNAIENHINVLCVYHIGESFGTTGNILTSKSKPYR